jgi:amidohydrolase
MLDPDNRAHILSQAHEIQPAMVRWRRHLHRHPEVSCEEFETTDYVARHLRALGLRPILEPSRTGLFVDIPGHCEGGRIALRADIDALPIPDAKEVSYRSTVDGVMHACGHDAHTAMVMGAAQLLVGMRDRYAGSVRLILQPSEERHPGGADEMIRRGVMDGVEAVLALHISPELPSGTVGLRPGAITASVAAFELAVLGKGGHPARPHLAVDPVFIVARLVQDILLGVSRRLDASQPVLVTIGEIHGGRAPNVIPGRASLAGSVRTASSAQMDRVPGLIHQLAQAAVATWGGTYDLDFKRGSDPVINDPALVHRMRALVTELLGAERSRWVDRPSMGGEDFSKYLDHAPGLMARLGSTRPGEAPPDLHTNTFDLDESCMEQGLSVLVGMSCHLLNRREYERPPREEWGPAGGR